MAVRAALWWTGCTAAIVLSGCSDSEDARRSTTTQASAEAGTPEIEQIRTARDLALAFGCERPERLHPMEGPIRGGAAIEGVRCFEEHVALDVFVRSPLREGVGPGSGGSLVNIHSLLDNGTPGPHHCGVLEKDKCILNSNPHPTLQ